MRTHVSAGRPETVVWQDAIVVVLLTAIAAALCVEFDISEALRRWTAPWERFQLDELPAVLLVFAATLAWFAVRRYWEAGRELLRRRAAEAQLAAALADNRRLSQQYVRLQEAERKALARELHDELGQYLNVIKLDAVGIRDERVQGSTTLRERAGAIIANCNHIHTALAALIRQLRPVGLDELGLEAALEHCIATWRPRLPQVRLALSIAGEFGDLTETVTLTAYRLIQEALTNVAKHASASQVTMQLERLGAADERQGLITITIVDDGVGTDVRAPTQGLGLIGLRERVAALEGRLEITTAPGSGFELKAQIPVYSPTERVG
jgi:two-component system, NarL family, sensor histidine kinase UhpB